MHSGDGPSFLDFAIMLLPATVVLIVAIGAGLAAVVLLPSEVVLGGEAALQDLYMDARDTMEAANTANVSAGEVEVGIDWALLAAVRGAQDLMDAGERLRPGDLLEAAEKTITVCREEEGGEVCTDETVPYYTTRARDDILAAAGVAQVDLLVQAQQEMLGPAPTPPPSWRPRPRTGWAWPVPGRWAVSSMPGLRIHPLRREMLPHRGVDIPAPIGTRLVAATAGTVSITQDDGCGLGLSIATGSRRVRYCHLESVAVAQGAQVEAGQDVGTVGSSGLSTGPHLHLEIWGPGGLENPLLAFGW